MSFVAHQVLGVLARPLTDLALLTLFALLASRRGLRYACAAAWLAVLVLPVQQWAAAPLENRFARPSPPPHVDGVVVLGGATNPSITAERGIPSLNGAAERMTEMAALARRYPDAKILFTGGYATLLPKSVSGGLTEAAVARQLMAELGVPPEHLLYEAQARDTWENAVFAKALAHPAAAEVWLLVTSAIHMPRAMAVFRAVGWEVAPWPVAYETPSDVRLAALASLAEKDRVLEDAGHEWAGLLTYWLEGRTRTILPAP